MQLSNEQYNANQNQSEEYRPAVDPYLRKPSSKTKVWRDAGDVVRAVRELPR